jgi:hypothetical protein
MIKDIYDVNQSVWKMQCILMVYFEVISPKG